MFGNSYSLILKFSMPKISYSLNFNFLYIYILFQYACDITAQVVGKPSPDFFKAALNDLGLNPEEVRFYSFTMCFNKIKHFIYLTSI